MMNEQWLKDDLLCIAGNAIKYSRTNQKTPAIMRFAIVPPPSVGGGDNVPSPSLVQFSFIDTGHPLPDEILTNLFDRPVYSERTQMGGSASPRPTLPSTHSLLSTVYFLFFPWSHTSRPDL